MAFAALEAQWRRVGEYGGRDTSEHALAYEAFCLLDRVERCIDKSLNAEDFETMNQIVGMTSLPGELDDLRHRMRWAFRVSNNRAAALQQGAWQGDYRKIIRAELVVQALDQVEVGSLSYHVFH